MKKDGILDKTVTGIIELIYSKEKSTERWLVLLTLFGFILRLIASLNLNAFADDMIKASQAAGIYNSGILSTSSHPALYYYLTDSVYKIFGYTTFASRFWPLIFGTLLIPLSFLITRKLFNEKIALASAFFVTFSAFLVRMTIAEETLPVLFLAFCGVYFGMNHLDNKKFSSLIISGIFFGLSSLTKYSAPFFIIAFLLFAAYIFKSKNEKILTKENIKHLFILGFIIVLISLPFITFNYILYKEKGITDIYFSRIFPTENSQKLYGSLGGQETTFFQNLFNLNSYRNISIVYKTDIVLFLFCLLGLYFMFKEKQIKQIVFFLIFLAVPFILQSAGSGLPKHFAFMQFLFAIPAGIALNKVSINKITRISLIFILISVMFVNLGTPYGTPSNYLSESDTSALKSFINNNVDKNSLLVFDSRIYTAQYFWLATDNHFINMQQFFPFYNYNENLTDKIPTKVYFVECVIDDCGWGTITSNQELNSSSEELFDSIRNQSELIEKIDSFDYLGNEIIGKKQSTEKYNIYLANLDLSNQIVSQTDYMNSFYFAPYLYKNIDSFIYNYELKTSFYMILNNLSLWIIKLSVLISFIIPLYLFFYLITFKNNV